MNRSCICSLTRQRVRVSLAESVDFLRAGTAALLVSSICIARSRYQADLSACVCLSKYTRRQVLAQAGRQIFFTIPGDNDHGDKGQ